MTYGLATLYLLISALLAIMGVHRWQLVYLYSKHRDRRPRLTSCFVALPKVTVQLPMFNEQFVAKRIIDAASQLDYPKGQLQIQVLDDSTDITAEIAKASVAYYQAAGFDITYIHRSDRTGYKAGALANGLKTATGEFVLIYDADFLIPQDNLLSTIHYFTDPTVGFVQCRWTHLNRDRSLLTKVQAIYLDAHFIIEHTARNHSGRLMTFNGTAGIWRTEAITTAGGWQHDTLTEDMDLSYRAQLVGFRGVYLPQLTCPAELPADMAGFKSQQFRWTKGAIENAYKLLPTIIKSKLTIAQKTEAIFHLVNPFAYFLVTLLIILLGFVFRFKTSFTAEYHYMVMCCGMITLLMASGSAATFYMVAQRERTGSMKQFIKYVPAVMALGIGIGLNNCIAIFQAMIKKRTPFVRTPKYSDIPVAQIILPDQGAVWRRIPVISWVELMMGLYVAIIPCYYAISHNWRAILFFLPFIFIFVFGYWFVALGTILPILAMAKRKRKTGRTVAEVSA
jgi:cellulose synthase/poly-beta-1,6-N-acetylglucosamine synthase-like glycosyltransferase